jgi:probable F420-dependent oxidoreductase
MAKPNAADELRVRCGEWGAWLTPFARSPLPDLTAAAQAYEKAGVATLWLGEEFAREIMAMSALVLSRTSVVTLATGIASIWARGPITMMNGARTLEEAYPGRLVLGVGVSHAPQVAERGHEFSGSVGGFRAYVERMRDARYAGAPVGDPPILLGALGPNMLHLAAAETGGSFAWLVPEGDTPRLRQDIGAEAFLAVGQAFVIATSRDQARATAGVLLDKYFGMPNYRHHFRRAGFADEDLVTPMSDQLFDALVAWGPPQRVLERVRRHLSDGADHIVLYPLNRDRGPSEVSELLRLHRAPLR